MVCWTNTHWYYLQTHMKERERDGDCGTIAQGVPQISMAGRLLRPKVFRATPGPHSSYERVKTEPAEG